MKYQVMLELNETEKNELRRAVKSHPFDYKQGLWRKMTEAQIKDAVVYCIASTQSRVGNVQKFLDASRSIMARPPGLEHT